MEENTLEVRQEPMKADKTIASENLKVLAQNSLAEIQKIQRRAKQELEKIRQELSMTDAGSPSFVKLKGNENFYLQALADSKNLNNSIRDKLNALDKIQGMNNPDLIVVENLIVNVGLKDTPNQNTTKQNRDCNCLDCPVVDAALIHKLRGLTPQQNLYLRQKNLESLSYLETDIVASSIISDKEKIGGLRSGLTVAEQLRYQQNENKRPERHLPLKERQKVRSYALTRVNQRGYRQRG